MISPARLLPHAAPMVLLDEVLSVGSEGAVAAVIIRAEGPFARPGKGVPAHVAIEWMAQTCGIFAGHEAIATGKPIRVGMLLGTRHFQATLPWFEVGERLVIKALLLLREAGMAVFDCSVSDAAGTQRATAKLTTYQFPEVEE